VRAGELPTGSQKHASPVALSGNSHRSLWVDTLAAARIDDRLSCARRTSARQCVVSSERGTQTALALVINDCSSLECIVLQSGALTCAGATSSGARYPAPLGSANVRCRPAQIALN
jgi:hypothetical protein